jgi:ATP-dependent DNA helicase RecG
MNNLTLPISINELIHGHTVEWERIEFKEGWNPEDLLHSICAFANDFHNLGGGYIVIGIAEKDGIPVLPPKGLEQNQIDKIQKELLNLGHSAIQPMYHPISVPYIIEKQHVLVIWVPGGETRPYQCKVTLSKNKDQWDYYIRKQSSSVRAIKQDRQELLGLAATVPFDDRINQRASIADLSLRLIEEYLSEVGSELADQINQLPIISIGRQMNIIGGVTEAPFPKNIGLMMFNDHPEYFFPVTQIDVVYFPDGPGGDIFEEKEFKGPLYRIIRDALSHIQRSYLKQTVIKYPDRAEADRIWNYPYAAIEEALVNAIYHRSYEIREPVEVRITPEELVILNFPGPDRSMKIEDIASGKAVNRRYRNRRIGEFLKELDLTEGRSTGIRKINRAIEQNGSPQPVFETDEDRTYFLVRFPVHPKSIVMKKQVTGQVTGQVADEVTGEVTGQVTGEVTPQVAPQVTPQVTPQVKKLLHVLTNEMDRQQILQALGLKARKNLREIYLKPALDSGLIEMTQPDSPKSPTQKYRLTEKGKQILENKIQ